MPLPSTDKYTFTECDTRITYCYNGCIIPRNQKKVREYRGSYGAYPNYRHYCLKCAVDIINGEMKDTAFVLKACIDLLKEQEASK